MLSSKNNTVISLINQLKNQPGALLPILHAIQDAIGYIPPTAVPQIAAETGQSRAEVHGVISFYPYFRTTKPGRHTLEICRAEACQAMGAENLAQHARLSLNCDFHATTTDGNFSLEPVYCLGLCAQSPAVMLNGRPHAHVTPTKLDKLIQAAGAQEQPQ